MNRLLFALTLSMSACDADVAPALDVQALTSGDSDPLASFDLPEDGTWVSPGPLAGRVLDDDQAPATLLVEVVSLIDGDLFYGNPDARGRWEWEGELTLGDNPVEVVVTDREGRTHAESALLQVRGNEAPRCAIITPGDGQVFAARTDIRFQARVSDGDGDALESRWTSSLDGGLALGEDFVLRLRETGIHEIRFDVRDPYGGSCIDAVWVEVR